MAGRAFQKRSPRGRCPSCHKLGLGDIKHSMVGSRGVAFRACRYCGEQVDMVDKPATPASDPAAGPTSPPADMPGWKEPESTASADAARLPTADLRSALVGYATAWATCDGADMSAVDAAMARVSEALDALDHRLGTTTRGEKAHG